MTDTLKAGHDTLALACNLIEHALREANRAGVRLQDDANVVAYAVAIKQQLDLFRICSECDLPVGYAADVCDDCWPAYQARCRAEDERDGDRVCRECGRPVASYAGDLCGACLDEERDRAWEEAQEEQRELAEERDWEGEAEAMRELELDLAVEAAGES